MQNQSKAMDRKNAGLGKRKTIYVVCNKNTLQNSNIEFGPAFSGPVFSVDRGSGASGTDVSTAVH